MVARRGEKTWSEVRIYVEGGGITRAQQAPLRIGFTQLFERHLGVLPRPQVIACGGRSIAYRDFLNGVAPIPRRSASSSSTARSRSATRSPPGPTWRREEATDGPSPRVSAMISSTS